MNCIACNNTGKEADGAAHTCTVCNGESAKPSKSSGKPERPVKRNGYPHSSNHRSFNEGFNSACDEWSAYAADLETELRVTKQALQSLKGECEDLRNAALTQYAKKAEMAEQDSGVHCTGHVDYDPPVRNPWGGISVQRDPALPSSTMIVSPDVFDMLKDGLPSPSNLKPGIV